MMAPVLSKADPYSSKQQYANVFENDMRFPPFSWELFAPPRFTTFQPLRRFFLEYCFAAMSG